MKTMPVVPRLSTNGRACPAPSPVAAVAFSVAITSALAGAACQDYYFLYRPNQRVAVTKMNEMVVKNTDTDILFVVDNSGSMKEEQANLIRNTRLFIEELSTSENAYRVGIVTTDLFNQADGGRLRMEGGDQPYLDRPDPDASDAASQKDQLVARFADTVESLGTGGSGLEAGLEAARRALDKEAYPEVGQYNSGFLRAEADLALIFLTDEDDCSRNDYPDGYSGSDCYEGGSASVDPESYVDALAALKGGSTGVQKVRAALIAGGGLYGENADFVPRGCYLTEQGSSEDCGCWSSSDGDFFCEYLNDYGHPCTDTGACLGGFGQAGSMCSSGTGTCDTHRCEALPGSRYHGFISALGERRIEVGFPRGTYEDSICQNEYDETLLRIARTVVVSSCFSVEEGALGPEHVRLQATHTDQDSGVATERVIPRIDETDLAADCQSCAECSDGAWRYVDERTFCLECDLRKETGDIFSLTFVNEVIGVDDE